MGTCCHTLVCRWLEQTDGDVSLASHAAMTRKDGPRTLQGCDAQLRQNIGGRPRSFPAKSALLTLESIIAEGKKRAEESKRNLLLTYHQMVTLFQSSHRFHLLAFLVILFKLRLMIFLFAQRSTCCSAIAAEVIHTFRRSGKRSEKDTEVRELFRTPTKKPRQADAAALAGQARTTAIVRIQKLLSSMDFRSRFEGTLLTKTVGLSLAEAKQKGIAQIIHALRHDTSSGVPLQLAAGQVLAGWK